MIAVGANEPAAAVNEPDGHERKILSVGANGVAVRSELDARRRARSLHLRFRDDIAAPAIRSHALAGYGSERSGLVRNLPRQMQLVHARPRSRPERLAIQEQLYRVGIRIRPDGNHLAAIFIRPVPMRQDVNHRLAAPPTLIQIETILREACEIRDS